MLFPGNLMVRECGKHRSPGSRLSHDRSPATEGQGVRREYPTNTTAAAFLHPPQLYYILRHNRCNVPACFTNAPASHGYTEHEKQTVYISCGQGFAASSRRRVAAGPKPSNRNTRTRKGVPRQDNCNRILVPPPPYEKLLTAP